MQNGSGGKKVELELQNIDYSKNLTGLFIPYCLLTS